MHYFPAPTDVAHVRALIGASCARCVERYGAQDTAGRRHRARLQRDADRAMVASVTARRRDQLARADALEAEARRTRSAAYGVPHRPARRGRRTLTAGAGPGHLHLDTEPEIRPPVRTPTPQEDAEFLAQMERNYPRRRR